MLRPNREMHDAFWAHFHGRFAHCIDFPVQEFRRYLADLHSLWEVETTYCEGLVTECEVRDELKLAGLKKSPGLNGLP